MTARAAGTPTRLVRSNPLFDSSLIWATLRSALSPPLMRLLGSRPLFVPGYAVCPQPETGTRNACRNRLLWLGRTAWCLLTYPRRSKNRSMRPNPTKAQPRMPRSNSAKAGSSSRPSQKRIRLTHAALRRFLRTMVMIPTRMSHAPTMAKPRGRSSTQKPVEHRVERRGETLTTARVAGTPTRLVRSNALLSRAFI